MTVNATINNSLEILESNLDSSDSDKNHLKLHYIHLIHLPVYAAIVCISVYLYKKRMAQARPLPALPTQGERLTSFERFLRRSDQDSQTDDTYINPRDN